MASRDSLEVRKLLETGVVIQQGADTPIAIRMRYTGTGSATSVTVTTATDLTTVSTEAGLGTVTKTYLFSTYSTVGELNDAILADGLFEPKVLDALRSDDTTGSEFVTGAITAGTDANGIVVWDVTVDTSVALWVTSCITNARNFNTVMLNRTHRVHLQQIDYFATLGAAGSNGVAVFLRRSGAAGIGSNTETQIYGGVSVSATAESIVFANGYGKISGQDGDELIVRLQDPTSISDTALSFRAIGILE